MRFRLGKLASWFLVLLAAAALLSPFLASLPAQPIEEGFDQGDTHLALTIGRDRVFLPSECVTADWQVEGIREVYFNGEGVVGEGQRTVCPAYGPVTLRALLPDGTEQTLTANVPVTSVTLTAFVLYGIGIGAFVLVCSRGSIPALTRLWARAARGMARVPALIAGLGNWLLAHPTAVVLAITLLGTALRFTGAGHRPLIQDESVLETIASGTIGDVIKQNAQWNSAPPLFALAINQVLVLGNSELLLRALPLFASILVIPAFFVLARRFVARGAAYLATVGIATALVPVYYAQYTREYSLTLLLSILALVFFLDYRANPSRRRLLTVGACWVVVILTQYGLALLILPLNLWLLLDAVKGWWLAGGRERRQIMAWAGWLQVALLLAVGAVFLLSLRDHMRAGSFAGEGYLSGGYWNQIPASLPGFVINTTALMAQAAYSANIFGQTWDVAVMLALTGFGALGVLLARRRTSLALLRTLTLAVFATAILFGLLRLYPYVAGRQAMMLVTFMFLLLAVAFSVMLRLRKERAVAAVTALAVVWMAGANIQNVTRYYVHPGFDDVTPIAADIAARWQDGDRLVLVNYAQQLFEHYFLQRYPEHRADSVAVGEDPAVYGSLLGELSAGPGRTWVVVMNDGDRFAAFAAEQPWADLVTPQMSWTNVNSFLITP